MNICANDIQQSLDDGRYETARRLCQVALHDVKVDRDVCLKLLHQTYCRLGDLRSASRTARELTCDTDDQRIERCLLLADDLSLLSAPMYHRDAEEARQGMTLDEYSDKMKRESAQCLEEAKALAQTDRQRQVIAAATQTSRAAAAPIAAATQAPSIGFGTLTGRILFADGSPAAAVTLTLGLSAPAIEPDASTYMSDQMHFDAHIPAQPTMTTRTDHQGDFRMDEVPAGQHEFLSVTLDPAEFDIATRFLARNIIVDQGQTTHLELTVSEWKSAPSRSIADPFAPEMVLDNVHYRLAYRQTLANPFYFDFPRQAVTFDLPHAAPANPAKLLLLCSHPAASVFPRLSENVRRQSSAPYPFQLIGNTLTFFTELPQITDRVFALYVATDGEALAFASSGELLPVPDAEGATAVIDTGHASFRIPWGEGSDSLPPLLAVRGEDAVWRGNGRLVLPSGVSITSRSTQIVASGPLVLTVLVSYAFSDGSAYALEMTAHRDEPYLLVHEVCPDITAAFEFSLREFTGGRGYLHWAADRSTVRWTDLAAADRECARLQESIPWWIPPAGFAFAMTPAALDQQDFIGIFTIRRGDWVDRKFEALAQGPGDDNRELDWPYPEMVGSTISMITAHTTTAGDAFFRFGFFDGERRWGILVSSIERNDGLWKEVSAVQHKTSAPTLQSLKDWRLDEPDKVDRPYVVTRQENLRALREKKKATAFAPLWGKIASGTCRFGPTEGLRFAVDNDPAIAWRKRTEIIAVAKIRSRMTLLGRDYSDMYSPVGARAITPLVEEFDLIAASGVFTPDEERLVRQFFMLMGHLYMEPDFMNWHYNSRNANFEADRTDVVGTIGMAFHGNADAKLFIDHAASLMEKSLEVYCTPGSGKWYENPSCYYLHGLKCRMNLAYHLATHHIVDPTSMVRLKDYLRWGVLLLTPPTPRSYEVMCKGGSDADYRQPDRVRRVAPIGDHAHIGPWAPDHYALMAQLYRKSDPQFADLLLWAWQASGADAGYFGNLPLLFASLSEADLLPAPAPVLTSRRLEGFGASFRSNFGQENEFFLLFKQGPGGYRYHRTEGSIILFADGKPLIYDGGEAGETWRHTTLSFHDAHMPLAPGHVERFHSFPAADFAQGVHPVALRPEEPVFLSDICHHDLVPLAFSRFAEPNPACARLVLSVKDQYVIMHDELNIEPGTPSYWHLQAVADAHTGNAAQGYRFIGRFGTDLQVLLPDQSFLAETVEQTPILEYHLTPATSFSMRHLMLTGKNPDHYLAVLRPLAAGQQPVTAREIRSGDRTIGVQVVGEGVNDQLFFQRGGTHHQAGDVTFTGRYAAVLRRPASTCLLLLDAGTLQLGDIRIESRGPAVSLELGQEAIYLTAEGSGKLQITGLTQPLQLDLDNNRVTMRLG